MYVESSGQKGRRKEFLQLDARFLETLSVRAVSDIALI